MGGSHAGSVPASIALVGLSGAREDVFSRGDEVDTVCAEIGEFRESPSLVMGPYREDVGCGIASGVHGGGVCVLPGVSGGGNKETFVGINGV